jgi:hypothetical protein
MADKVALGSGNQHDPGSGGVDGGLCRLDPFDGERQIVERFLAVACRIFDGEPRNSGLDAEADILRHGFRLMGIAGFKIGIDRKVDRGDDSRDVFENDIARDGPVGVGQAAREGKAGAGCCKSLEAKAAEIAGRTYIPGIGKEEATALRSLRNSARRAVKSVMVTIPS